MLLSALECEGQELSVLITGDEEMKELNGGFRRKAVPTDVLSFCQQEGEVVEGGGGVLGDVVISLDTAARQATEFGVSLAEEVLRLLVHGVLHLRGYEHEGVSPQEARRMARLEEKLRRELRDRL